MSSSSLSRSPSPHTPDPVTADQLSAISIHDANPWSNNSWHLDSLKSEDSHMLQLDDLIEQHAYEDAPKSPSSISPITTFRSSLPPATINPIPPPVVVLRNPDHSSRNIRVVHPTKDSCFNLPIFFPSIPEGGTKSRVETQIRVSVDLVDPSSSSDPNTYDRVGSWKWLKLPPGTATKKRTRKQGKIDPDPQDMLHLTATITCATPPYNRVLSCSSCQTREAKRVAKKIAARVRPARSDSDSPDDPAAVNKNPLEDTSSIIQFNCAQVVDFSTGSAVLPLRITCYCRHHREKTGFNVNFAMMDYAGRTVGVGSSGPIMITDDHKTTGVPKHPDLQPYDWCQPGNSPAPETATAAKKAPSKRKSDAVGGKKRVKPYDSSAKPNRGSRETSVVSSAPSPAASEPSVSSASTPPPSEPLPSTQVPPLQYVSQESESSPDVLPTPLDMNLDLSMLPEDANFDQLFSNPLLVVPPQPPPPQAGVSPSSTTLMSASLPFLFNPPQTNELTLPMPTIHRLIPNCGPTHGGIEVTVLGANFHPTLQFNCIFGDMRASSTQRWSDNTLVCILPPRGTPGMVSVWFEGFPKDQPPSFFTYSDESDRALMELALRVVGLKMTGHLEDAKNVAMRIIGAGEGTDSLNSGNGQGNSSMNMQLSAARDLRSLMLVRAGESEGFESLIVNFLKLIDTPVDHPSAQRVSVTQALSHTTNSGQSLLHLAAFLGYGVIVDFLVHRGIDLDIRDRNGYTALHFAAMAGSKDCVVRLLRAGADHEIVNALGKTAEEIVGDADISFEDILEDISESRDSVAEDDEEAEWGDAEEDAEEEPAFIRRAKIDKRARRSRAASRRASREELKAHHLTPKTSLTSISATCISATSTPDGKKEKKEKEATADEKQALSFLDLLQRTMAQLPGAPQFPLPQFPPLPGVPAVPWESLHQLQFPMVFPVAVPLLPGWLGGEHREGTQDQDTENVEKVAGPFKAAQEWRALWERWLAHVPTWQQAAEMPPPPEYTPRAATPEAPLPTTSASTQQQLVRRVSSGASESEMLPPPLSTASGSRSTQDSRRRYDYSSVPVTDQEVKAYAYQPKPQQKKHDRMLILFWLPILMISLLWACHAGFHFVIRAFRTPMTFKKVLGY